VAEPIAGHAIPHTLSEPPIAVVTAVDEGVGRSIEAVRRQIFPLHDMGRS